ncbi:MAG: hypothetical protein R3236_08420 [Phycisphaeraceae bacterium]|nr:hypothetical protein [Phycisphaeraceae bacterium]
MNNWHALLDGSSDELLEAALATEDLASAAAIGRLRRLGSPQLVHLAIELALGRRKLQSKVDDPSRYVADTEAAEQSTPLPIARHKARRFVAAGCRRIADLCCGMGLDAAALAEIADLDVFDLAPSRAWMARRNVETHTSRKIGAVCADVTALNWHRDSWDGLHLDPSRRTAGGRIWNYQGLAPAPSFFEPLSQRTNMAVKLSPAVDAASLPTGHVEWIARDGRLNQAVLWTGRLAFAPPHQRTATRLDSGCEAESWTAEADLPIPSSGHLDPPVDWFCLVDPVVERAGLCGALCAETGMEALHPALGILLSDESTGGPWLKAYRHLASMPWRLGPVRRWCRDHGAGEVTVKTRNRAVNPDRVSMQLRGGGDQPLTVFILDHGRKRMAHIAGPADARAG